MANGKIGVTTENIFPVIKKFLYSDHEIFLRELVANAVDATQKMKAVASRGEFNGELGDLLSVLLVTAIQAKGSVLIHQKMFESRLFFVDKLIDMGAD